MQVIQRLATLALIQAFSGKNIDHAVTESRKQARGALTEHQRAAMQDAVYGVLRHRTELERVLQPLFNRTPPKDALFCLLLVCAYQLLHTRLAPHAVVVNAVEVSVTIGGATVKGFVNGLLRNLLRQKEMLLKQAHQTPEGRYSHPSWWIEKLQSQYPDQWESILTHAQEHPPMTLRVNRRNSSIEQYQARLKQAGIDAEPIGEMGLLLSKPMSVSDLPGFEQGDVSVQDASAQLAASFLQIRSGQRILDACAAPGGKAAHILERGNGVDLLALDIEPGRVKKMGADLDRLKLKAHTLVADATNPSGWWDGVSFQRILIDAPCSGSGVVRRHPDIKWLRRPTDLQVLAERQFQLLLKLWPLLSPAGCLLYVTCSLFEEENHQIVDRFLKEQQGVERIELKSPLLQRGQVMPNATHDGFFYALLQKVA